MPEPTDEQLLAAFTAGDRDALGMLATRYEGPLLGLASGLLAGSRSLAADAVQEMWLRVIKKATGFQGRSSVKTWLYRILINTCHDLRNRQPVNLGPAAAVENALSDASLSAAAQDPPDPTHDTGPLRAALESMTEPRRLTLLLCYHAGMRHELAADILGVPLGTLKSRLHAALKELRTRLTSEVTP